MRGKFTLPEEFGAIVLREFREVGIRVSAKVKTTGGDNPVEFTPVRVFAEDASKGIVIVRSLNIPKADLTEDITFKVNASSLATALSVFAGDIKAEVSDTKLMLTSGSGNLTLPLDIMPAEVPKCHDTSGSPKIVFKPADFITGLKAISDGRFLNIHYEKRKPEITFFSSADTTNYITFANVDRLTAPTEDLSAALKSERSRMRAKAVEALFMKTEDGKELSSAELTALKEAAGAETAEEAFKKNGLAPMPEVLDAHLPEGAAKTLLSLFEGYQKATVYMSFDGTKVVITNGAVWFETQQVDMSTIGTPNLRVKNDHTSLKKLMASVNAREKIVVDRNDFCELLRAAGTFTTLFAASSAGLNAKTEVSCIKVTAGSGNKVSLALSNSQEYSLDGTVLEYVSLDNKPSVEFYTDAGMMANAVRKAGTDKVTVYLHAKALTLEGCEVIENEYVPAGTNRVFVLNTRPVTKAATPAASADKE